MNFCVLLDFVGELVKLFCEFFPFKHDFIVLLGELNELFFEPNDLIPDGAEFTLIVFSAHLVLLKLPQQGLQLVPLQPISFKRLLELAIGISHLKNLLFVLFRLLIYALDLIPMLFDEFDVVASYLVVVVLQLCKSLVVILHELIYVQIFALLQLVHFYPLLEFQFFPHLCQLCLIAFLHITQLRILLSPRNFLLPFVVMLGKRSLLNVHFLLLDYIFLEILLFLLHVFHPVLVIRVLLDL